MKLPFVYPEHPQFKAHVKYVKQELITFRRQSHKQGCIERCADAEARAKDIVLWVTSTPASRRPSKDFHLGYIVGAAGGVLATWLALTI